MTDKSSEIPVLNILVVGNEGVAKNKFIKFWLSLDDMQDPKNGIYNKIIWIDSKPLQLNIHEVSHIWLDTYLLDNNVTYQCVIYLMSIMDDRTNIDDFNKTLESHIQKGSYRAVIEVTFLDYLAKTQERIQENVDYYSSRNMRYHYASLRTDHNGKLCDSANLQKIINIITEEACSHVPDFYFYNSMYSHDNRPSDLKEENLHEMMTYSAYDGSTDPLLQDIYIRKSKKDSSCCIII